VTDRGTPEFALHPLHGVPEPTTSNLERRPGSARRTTSIDMTRDEGALDPVYMHERAICGWRLNLNDLLRSVADADRLIPTLREVPTSETRQNSARSPRRPFSAPPQGDSSSFA
jgi:hypothetical protein